MADGICFDKGGRERPHRADFAGPVDRPLQVDLQKIPAGVSERLCFFASSLRAILKQGAGARPEMRIRPGRDTLLDSEVGALPTLTQVVPVYEEQIILTEEFLCASDGRNTNLGFLIAQAGEDA